MEKKEFTKLNAKLKKLADKSSIEQMMEINDIRGEHTVAAKALAEEYMKKELAVYNKIIV